MSVNVAKNMIIFNTYAPKKLKRLYFILLFDASRILCILLYPKENTSSCGLLHGAPVNFN